MGHDAGSETSGLDGWATSIGVENGPALVFAVLILRLMSLASGTIAA
jgi:hypothetical protein